MSTKMRRREHDDPVKEGSQDGTKESLVSDQTDQLGRYRVTALGTGVTDVRVNGVDVEEVLYRVGM